MSQPKDTAARYDQIAEVYDETREPLTLAALDKFASILSRDGNRRILEAGVGTGRIALPLQRRGFEMTGVDLSRQMLAKARGKGVIGLILADADHLPFREKKFDAALLAHVLHLLNDPARTFRGLAQMTTNEILALVTRRDREQDSEDETFSLRERFRSVAAELGYSRPGGWEGMRHVFQRETEFLTSQPPTELLTLEDREVVTTVGERLLFLEKRPYGRQGEIPEKAFREIVRRVAASSDVDRVIRYRRVEQVAIWKMAS